MFNTFGSGGANLGVGDEMQHSFHRFGGDESEVNMNDSRFMSSQDLLTMVSLHPEMLHTHPEWQRQFPEFYKAYVRNHPNTAIVGSNPTIH